MLYVDGSISTKSTSAPQYLPQLADAVKVIGDVQRISSLPNPAERQEICKAAVALVTATAYLAPQYSATHFSNFSIAGPCVKKSDFKTSTTASISFSSMLCFP